MLALFMSNREFEIKEKAIERIIANQMNSLRAALMRWRNTSMSLGINSALTDEKKKFLVGLLLKFLKGNKTALLREVLNRFFNESQVNKKIRMVFFRLLSTATGGLFDSFAKWKTIPNERGDLSAGRKFETILNRFLRRQLKQMTWNPLTDIY